MSELHCIFIFARSEFPKHCGRWGEKEVGVKFSFVCTHLLCDSALKRDYIITIVASEPSAFLYWLVYSGPSDPDKDRAFQQFRKQETQTHSHTSLQSNSSTRSVTSEKTKKRRRPYYHQVIWLLTMGWLILVRHITHVQTDGASPFFFSWKSDIFQASAEDCVKPHEHMTHFFFLSVSVIE